MPNFSLWVLKSIGSYMRVLTVFCTPWWKEYWSRTPLFYFEVDIQDKWHCLMGTIVCDRFLIQGRSQNCKTNLTCQLLLLLSWGLAATVLLVSVSVSSHGKQKQKMDLAPIDSRKATKSRLTLNRNKDYRKWSIKRRYSNKRRSRISAAHLPKII